MIDSISFLVLLSCLTLRIFPRILWKDFNGTDSHFHFYYIELIKKNNNRIPNCEPRVLGGSNDCSYPYFYHWLLSFFPVKIIEFWDKFSGFIFDFVNALCVILLVALHQEVSFSIGCMILASYIIAPGLTFSFIGPRPYSLTPRNFSQFIFCLGCLFLILSTLYGGAFNYFFYISATIAFAILFLSSQFASQVLCFILLGSFFDLRIGATILMGFLLGIILSKGSLIRQIKSHILHLEWYFKHNYAFVQHKTNFHKLFKLVKEKKVRDIFYELVFHNQISTAILRHSTYFVSLFLGLFLLSSGDLNNIQKETLFLLIPLFLAYVITNFGKARVFGEAERYIEFAYPLQIFLFLSFVPDTYIKSVLALMAAYNLLWYFYNLYQMKHQNLNVYSYHKLLLYLKKENINLLCLNNNESYIFLRHSNVNIVGFLVNISLLGKYHDFFKKFFIKYPLVNPKNLKELCGEYKVTHVLRNKQINAMETYNYETIINSIDGFMRVYEDNKYALYEKSI